MKKTSYIGKTKDELVKSLYAKREDLRGLGFSLAGSKQKNVKESSTLKKDIARIMTELNKIDVGKK